MKHLEDESAVLGQLEVAVKQYQARFDEAVQTIRNEQVSNYPILVAYPSFTTINIGLLLQEGEALSFNATTLEELAVKKVVNMEKVNSFREVYKKKSNYFCVFLLERPAPQFVFIPYA